MCNKRIRNDKYNDGDNIMASRGSLILLFCILLSVISCSPDGPVFVNDVVVDEYPKLADAIITRDAERLLTYSNHEDKEIRSLAWRAIAKSEVNTPDSLLQTVISANEHASWLGLSTHGLSGSSLDQVRDLFSDNPNVYQYACEIFKRQGDEQDIELILQKMSELTDPQLCSIAVGRILTYDEYTNNTIRAVIEAAFGSESAEVRKNLLYGFYRSTLNRAENGSEFWNSLRQEWIELGIGQENMTDQYLVGILGGSGSDLFIQNVSFPGSVSDQQLLIEVVRSMNMAESYTEENRKIILDILSHDNPTVVTEMLERLKLRDSLVDLEINKIYSHHIQRTRNGVIFVTALELLLPHGIDINPLSRKLDYMAGKNPYLTNRILAIYRQMEPSDEYLDRLRVNLSQGGIRSAHAVQALTDYWIALENPQEADQIRNLVWETAEAGRASAVSGLTTLLSDEELVLDDDFGWLQARYQEAVNSDNSVNMTAFQQALEVRFPERAGDFTDPEDPLFRIPNWERLHEMGTRPYWHLKTEKGEIVVRLNPLSAPFTASSVDSLTRAGAYDGVAFHRVVHNFVIQGGDVGRGDGFGGPDYTIPTEPSLKTFERGAVGIASSGTDTESSQYFVMHQWKPHLDAEYTRFGIVVRGMDVVDRIQIGDLVEQATISVN